MKFILDCIKMQGTLRMRKVVSTGEKTLLRFVKTLFKQGTDTIEIQVDRRSR